MWRWALRLSACNDYCRFSVIIESLKTNARCHYPGPCQPPAGAKGAIVSIAARPDQQRYDREFLRDGELQALRPHSRDDSRLCGTLRVQQRGQCGISGRRRHRHRDADAQPDARADADADCADHRCPVRCGHDPEQHQHHRARSSLTSSMRARNNNVNGTNQLNSGIFPAGAASLTSGASIRRRSAPSSSAPTYVGRAQRPDRHGVRRLDLQLDDCELR